MGRLIVMIMTGPVGVIVHSIIIVVGNSLKRELNFSLLDLENIKTKKESCMSQEAQKKIEDS